MTGTSRTQEPEDHSAFDLLVAALDGGMVVVTAAADGDVGGCLVGFHSQCSIEPRGYAVWISVANRTFELAQRSTHLAVHLLGDDQRAVAALFGSETGDEVDKLARTGWVPGPDGVPVLDVCTARFVGRIAERAPGFGDHELFVLDVVEAQAPAGGFTQLRLSAADDLDPGHAATERR